jgi:8-oxo-dGTP diphosphatase
MKNVVLKVLTAGAIIRSDKILIVQRSLNDNSYPGLWELPSGKKEPLELATDSVVREVLEETGLRIKTVDIIHTFNFIADNADETKDFTQLVFYTEETGQPQEVVLSREHQAYRWVIVDELNNLNISQETKEGIIKAFRYTKNSNKILI